MLLGSMQSYGSTGSYQCRYAADWSRGVEVKMLGLEKKSGLLLWD